MDKYAKMTQFTSSNIGDTSRGGIPVVSNPPVVSLRCAARDSPIAAHGLANCAFSYSQCELSTLPEMLVLGFESPPSKSLRRCLYSKLMSKWKTTVAQWAKEENYGLKLKKVIGVGDEYRRYLALPNAVAREFMDVHGGSAMEMLRREGSPEIMEAIRVMEEAVHGHVKIEDGDENDAIEI